MPLPENGKQLLAKEQELFCALERNLVLADFLTKAELECVATAGRYYLTFHEIDYEERLSAQPLPRLAALLEQTGNEDVK